MAAGLDPAAFWAVTPREAMVILDGADARALRDLRVQQQMAYSAAVLISTAMNNPKRFPKFEKAFPDGRARRVRQDPDTIFAVMEAWAKGAQAAAIQQEGTD